MTLKLEKGATLSFLGYDSAVSYPVARALLPGPDGQIAYEYPSLITGNHVHHVVITGGGMIDGNGETWWPHYKELSRPFTIEFILSSNILVQGITIRDPPCWNNHLLYVDSAIYTDVRFLKVSRVPGVNGDGLDPDASQNILVVGCLFGNQDDCIAIKSGKFLSDGNKRRRPSENIVIRDCLFDGNAAPGSNPLGIALGSESSGGIKHVLIQHCVFRNVASLVNIKTNRQRPFANVEDVRVEHVTYVNRKAVDHWWNRAPISVDLFYGENTGDPSIPEPLAPQTPVFRDIHFKDISIYNSVGRGIYLSGLRESPIGDISFSRVFVTARDGMVIQNVDAFSTADITVKKP
jgi:polygalacturonase